MICEFESKTYAWYLGVVLLSTPMDGQITQVDKELRRAEVGNKGVIIDERLRPERPAVESAGCSRRQVEAVSRRDTGVLAVRCT